jgi:hypothetical protein
VSLFALAKQQGRHFRKLKQEMDEAGIEPAFDINVVPNFAAHIRILDDERFEGLDKPPDAGLRGIGALVRTRRQRPRRHRLCHPVSA